jgi:metal-responsive CopG/Arc/MetJ family transcriptional regulator
MLYYYTYGMKTAISVPDDIFKEVDKLAKDHNCSRSEVFVIAVKQYLEKIKSQEILAALNMTYSEQESLEERSFRKKSKRHFAKKVLKET